jgi:hypothetical protein
LTSCDLRLQSCSTTGGRHRAAASVGVPDPSLTVAGRALDGIDFTTWPHWLLHDWVARSIAGRADMLFDLRTIHAARPPFAVSQMTLRASPSAPARPAGGSSTYLGRRPRGANLGARNRLATLRSLPASLKARERAMPGGRLRAYSSAASATASARSKSSLSSLTFLPSAQLYNCEAGGNYCF